MPKPERSKSDDDETPLLEWIFGAVGLLLFVGAVTTIVLNGLASADPPSIVTKVSPAVAVEGGFSVEFEAENLGDETAALVLFVATFRRGEEVVETRTVEIDFLPAHGKRGAAVFFEGQPADGEVDVRAVSYQRP